MPPTFQTAPVAPPEPGEQVLFGILLIGGNPSNAQNFELQTNLKETEVQKWRSATTVDHNTVGTTIDMYFLFIDKQLDKRYQEETRI